MELLTGVSSDAPMMPRVLAHYAAVAPLLEASFAGAPIVYRNHPAGLDTPGLFRVTSLELEAKALLWLVHAKHAIEYYTWAPMRNDDDRLRFGRILLEAPTGADFTQVKRAAIAVRELLRTDWKLQAIPIVDGGGGIALWLPFADAPHAATLRAWLYVVANRAAATHPDLISTEPNTHDDGRVHVHVSSNAAGHYSAMPYSLRAQGLTVCAPVQWAELEDLPRASIFTAEHFAARLRARGDLFAKETAQIGKQVSPCAAAVVAHSIRPMPLGHIIIAAIEILSDGRLRNAHEILAAALARNLVPPQTTYAYAYSALIEYIAREIGRGRKPPILQDDQRRFRIDEPPDDWPDLVPARPPQTDEAAQALCDRLDATGSGKDPAAFEAAVCDAFAHLGFLTQHLGQHAAPDGVADAILGIDGFRVLLECKTAKVDVIQPQPIEVAKFRDEYRADYCVMVGPHFGDEMAFLMELQKHNVTAMALPELKTLLHVGANPLEVKALLKPGYASDGIADFLWARAHGAAKRIATIAFLLRREGWRAQYTAAEQGDRARAPRLTIDAAMLMIDAALHAAGSQQSCDRDEVEEAFHYLTSRNVGAARMEGDALVILHG
ncbi:MAG: non-homologous end-joining DNA ligase LigD [Candidatus Tyrphobacter sp.]